MVEIRNASEFCEHVENMLGWLPDPPKPGAPRRGRYFVEAGKLNRKVKSDPALFTWENLTLTVQWLQRKRKQVTPTGVCWHVEEALKEAAVADPLSHPITAQVHQCIVEAMVAGEAEWVEQLARAVGSARLAVVEDWRNRA